MIRSLIEIEMDGAPRGVIRLGGLKVAEHEEHHVQAESRVRVPAESVQRLLHRARQRQKLPECEVLTLASQGRFAVSINQEVLATRDRKSTRLNSSHGYISYSLF